jgi:nucleotide-binding universal stress UspA family protein
MNSDIHPYTVVVGVDYSESSDLVLETALDQAAEKPGAVVHVLHALPAPQSFLTPDVITTVEGKVLEVGECAQELKQYVSRIVEKRTVENRRSPSSIVTHVMVESAAQQVAQLAADLEADLVVVGTHGRRGVPRLLLGSVAEMTLRLAPCPVLVVRRKSALVPAPSLEPPCERCIHIRHATAGREFWCETHLKDHEHRHAHHQSDQISSGRKRHS